MYASTHPCIHVSMLTIHNLIYSRLKQVTNRDLSRRKTADWSRKCGRSTFENNFVYESKIDLICTVYGNQCSTHCCSQNKSKNMHSMLERETAASNKLIWGKDCRETQRKREKSANLYHCLMRPMASHPTQKKNKETKQNKESRLHYHPSTGMHNTLQHCMRVRQQDTLM